MIEAVLASIVIVLMSILCALLIDNMYSKEIVKIKRKEVQKSLQNKKMLLEDQIYTINKIQDIESKKIPEILKEIEKHVSMESKRDELINKIIEIEEISKEIQEV